MDPKTWRLAATQGRIRTGDCHTAWPTSPSCAGPFDSATWPEPHRFRQKFHSLVAWRACGSHDQRRPTGHWRRRRQEQHDRALLAHFGQSPAAGTIDCRHEGSSTAVLGVSCEMGMVGRLTTTFPNEICVLFLVFGALRSSFRAEGMASNRIACTGGRNSFKEPSKLQKPSQWGSLQPSSGMVSVISTDCDMQGFAEMRRVDDNQQWVGDEG